jgi:hypothetical protein
MAGSVVVTEIARHVPDACRDLFYSLKRLLGQLASDHWNERRLQEGYLSWAAGWVEPDTPLLIDLTDLAKPRARRLAYLQWVRDEDQDRLVPGYWCVSVQAVLSRKRLLPLSQRAFSVADPAVGSQNLEILRCVQQISAKLSNRGIWVADRGFDAWELISEFVRMGLWFVIRQRGDRTVILPNGVRILERDLAAWLHPQAGPLSWQPIRLPGCTAPMTLVIHWPVGHEHPLLLLTNLTVGSSALAHQMLWYYRRRWACEEAIGFLKGRLGLERFRVRRYDSMQRLLLLAMLAMAFLTWLLIARTGVADALLATAHKALKPVAFLYYRLLTALQILPTTTNPLLHFP